MIRRGSVPATLLLAGCLSGPPGTQVPHLPEDAGSRGYVLVPRPVTLPHSQKTKDCAPECLCAVLNFWGKAITIEELSQLAGQNEGLPTTDMCLIARQRGCKPTLAEGSVGRLKKSVDRGVPPLIGVASGRDALGRLKYHVFVVSGYSDKEQRIVCEEYKDSKRLIAYDEIEEYWEPTGHFMLEVEPSNANDDFVQGANLESKGLYPEAAAYYRRALKADPEHHEAHVGLGNCLLVEKKKEEALEEYKRAYDLNPADPKVLNNLANVYVELKRELPEAVRLSERAVDQCAQSYRRAKEDMEKEGQPSIKALRQNEVAALERHLAHALGTLGQAQAASGRHREAIASWMASYDHFPLTEFHFRAKRQYEIGISYRALGMPAEARRHLQQALEESKDPAQRAQIEAALQSPK